MMNSKYLNNIINSFSKIYELENEIKQASKICINSIKNNKKIYFCGNGGSAADSQHLAAELIGKFLKNRKSLPAESLTTNTSIITAISNDFSFDNIFSRQLESLGMAGDTLFAITTSGKSKNINKAIKLAIKKKMQVILLTSIKCKIKSNKKILVIKVKNTRTDRIQEQHITIGHIICETIEQNAC
jgi:D-sedoheptulose 7-phosphate isomerase